MSSVPLTNLGKGEERNQLLRLLYHRYTLQKEATIYDLTKEELENHISGYCLMLQYQDQKEWRARDLYTIDVIGEFGQKDLPSLGGPALIYNGFFEKRNRTFDFFAHFLVSNILKPDRRSRGERSQLAETPMVIIYRVTVGRLYSPRLLLQRSPV